MSLRSSPGPKDCLNALPNSTMTSMTRLAAGRNISPRLTFIPSNSLPKRVRLSVMAADALVVLVPMTPPRASSSVPISLMPAEPLFSIGTSSLPCSPNSSIARAALAVSFGNALNLSADSARTWSADLTFPSMSLRAMPNSANFLALSPSGSPPRVMFISLKASLRTSALAPDISAAYLNFWSCSTLTPIFCEVLSSSSPC